nr:DUF2922 domain-containing protein [uncultured Bacillus sp.]
MAKTIELQFTNTNGKVSNLVVDNPKEPIDPGAIKTVMERIITANVFSGKNGEFVSIAKARLVDHNVTEYELV